MTIPSVDSTTLNNLSPNLDIGDVADPALRLASFQYIYTQMQTIVSELNNIPAGNLQNLSVTTGKIAELAVTTGKIAELAVTTAKLNDLAVTLAKMAANSVGTPQLIDQCVTTAKIALASVGVAQLSPGAQVNESVNNALIVALKAEVATIATVTSSQVGITGDGSDETSKIASMIALIPANGAKLVFDKNKKITVNGTSQLVISNKKNVVIEGLNVTGASANLFKISDGSSHITFRDCYFHDVSQVILLFACENITIDNCVFDTTGYGIIQQVGYISNNVKVINNTAKNVRSDFVEANCAATAPSKNWIISGNHFLGSSTYPTTGTETRFVGVTAVANVTISNNIVEKTTGDSAIHLEDISGDTQIIGNVFDNCAGGPYIYFLNSAESTIVSSNTFKRTDVSIADGTAIDLSSGDYDNDLLITGNRFIGTANNLVAINLADHDQVTITGNRFEDCDVGLNANNTEHVVVVGNSFKGCNYGIQSLPAASGGSNNYWVVQGNQFEGTIARTIDINRNTTGTGASNGWIITGNYFDKDARAFDTQDFSAFANQCNAGAVINFGDTFYIGSTRYNYGLNVVTGTGITARSAANPDTSGATLAALETEVNDLKGALRSFGIIA